MDEKNLSNKIIGNESNMEYEIEPTSTRDTVAKPSEEEVKTAHEPLSADADGEKTVNNDLTTNDGSVVETLDTAFHGKPGTAEGENPSGSDRADYYEKRSQGRSDATEEVK